MTPRQTALAERLARLEAILPAVPASGLDLDIPDEEALRAMPDAELDEIHTRVLAAVAQDERWAAMSPDELHAEARRLVQDQTVTGTSHWQDPKGGIGGG